jgi:hypothetical protein
LALRDYESRRAPAGPSTWLGQHIIPNPKKGHQPVPSHAPDWFYAAIPLLSALYILNPAVFAAVTSAIAAAEALARLFRQR